MSSGQWLNFAVNGASTGLTWSTIQDVNVGETGLWVMGHGLKREDPYEPTNSPGQFAPGEMVGGTIVVPPTTIDCRWQYRGACPKMLSLGTGSDAISGSTQHSITPYGAGGSVGRILTGAIRTQLTTASYRYEDVPSFKITGWEIKGQIPGFLEISFDIVADNYRRGGDETVSSFANVTHAADDQFQAVVGNFFSMANHTADPAAVIPVPVSAVEAIIIKASVVTD